MKKLMNLKKIRIVISWDRVYCRVVTFTLYTDLKIKIDFTIQVYICRFKKLLLIYICNLAKFIVLIGRAFWL